MADLCGHGWSGVLVTGPLMPGDDQRALSEQAGRTRVTCVPFVDDMAGLLGRADVVVAMAGYNTVCEVLAASAPAVMVPRVAPRQEQLLRASRMAERGLVRLVHPETMSGQSLAGAVRDQAEIGREEIGGRLASQLDLGGLRRAASILAADVARRPARVPA
jgi:predicted glycosyltransferase